MYSRKEKENEMMVHHSQYLQSLNVANHFTVKTAFFAKGKIGRNIQLFEGELNKSCDIYIELIDFIRDSSGNEIDMIPMYEERPLFKYKHNPYYNEEYETKTSFSSKGGEYTTYVIPVAELLHVDKNGIETSYNQYEKARMQEPKVQNNLSIFPDFEKEFIPEIITNEDEQLNSMTIRDFASIIWSKPVSNKTWLNELINKQKV